MSTAKPAKDWFRSTCLFVILRVKEARLNWSLHTTSMVKMRRQFVDVSVIRVYCFVMYSAAGLEKDLPLENIRQHLRLNNAYDK